jgi:PKD repeat protein
MRNITLTIWIITFFSVFAHAQTGCPGCAVNVPPGLPADTVYLPDLPDGVAGTAYDFDLSFRLPKTTTPVNAIDSTTPPGLNISKFDIVSIDGLPAGLYWQPNKFSFNTASETDGCIKICGTPYSSDSFELTVTLRATVFFIEQEATFPMSLYIAPKVSDTEGFSMLDPEGCGSTTVTFTNNIPSGGMSGFTYTWDFGDGSPLFTGETPPPHTYSEPGAYTVTYQATVDTSGYILESVRILDVECVDELGLGSPDLFMKIFAPVTGAQIFDSSPAVNNAPLPYLFPVGLPLGAGNYTLKVIDDDSGLKGTDDDCGVTTFNYLSNGLITAGGLTVELNIIHLVEEITSVDTVVVFPQPVAPTISTPNGNSICDGDTGLVLLSSYGSGNQWILDGSNIPGATDFIYAPTESGSYQAQIISQFGCVATSAAQEVTIHPLPQSPVWYNYNNSLRLFDTTALPAQYSLQWFNGTDPIPGETGFWYCTMSGGTYGLQVTDLSTGCVALYSNLVEYNPAFDCTVGVQSVAVLPLEIIPNPARTTAQVYLPEAHSGGLLRLWDATGRLVQQRAIAPEQHVYLLDVSQEATGFYVVEVITAKHRMAGKLGIGQ